MHWSDGDVPQHRKVYQQTEATVARSGAAWPATQQPGGKLRTLSQAVILCQGTSILRHVLYFDWMPVNQHVWNSLEGQLTTNFLHVCLAWDSYPILVIILVLHAIIFILPSFSILLIFLTLSLFQVALSWRIMNNDYLQKVEFSHSATLALKRKKKAFGASL